LHPRIIKSNRYYIYGIISRDYNANILPLIIDDETLDRNSFNLMAAGLDFIFDIKNASSFPLK
jgi:hypothetical protein